MKTGSIRAALLSGVALVLTGLGQLTAQVPSTLPQQGGAGQPGGIRVQPPVGQPGGPAVQPGGAGQPGGPGGVPPGRIGISGGVGGMHAKAVMTYLDTNKDGKVSKEEFIAGAEKFFKECDTGNTGKINEKAITDQLNKFLPQVKGRPVGPVIKPVGPGAPGNPGGNPAAPGLPPVNPGVKPLPPQPAPPPAIQPGPGGAGGAGGRPQPTVVRVGLGNQLAKGIVRRTGTDKENNVTLEKFKAAAETYFKEIDKDKNGSLDEMEIAAGIDLLMPFGVINPGGFGGAGGAPPGIAVPPGIPAPPAPPGRVAPQPAPAIPGGAAPAPAPVPAPR